jgi:hypothetical protein
MAPLSNNICRNNAIRCPQSSLLSDRRERVAEWGRSSLHHSHLGVVTRCYLLLDQKSPKAWRRFYPAVISYDSLRPPFV